LHVFNYICGDRLGGDRMVVGFTTTCIYAISAITPPTL